MKKLTLLILLVLVASTLVAAIPTKTVRLVVINKSGYDVYIKLEGSALTQAFYYLSIPAGEADLPTIKIFTIMVDYYTRTTWQCGGAQSTGAFLVASNTRLTFTPCDFNCGRLKFYNNYWVNRCSGLLYGPKGVWHVKAGEPTMEKVTYFKYFVSWAWGANPYGWAWVYPGLGWWNYGCGLWWWELRTWKTPLGCAWRYQY